MKRISGRRENLSITGNTMITLSPCQKGISRRNRLAVCLVQTVLAVGASEMRKNSATVFRRLLNTGEEVTYYRNVPLEDL